MPADENCPEYFPVINFESYTSKLNPYSDRLWQYPKDSYMSTDECWFQKKPIGRDSLSQFMPKLSQQIGLSTIYTNNSVRATGATILGMNFSVAQIMSVTGHTSVSSCAVYQRVSNNEKQVMGDVISSPIKCQVPALPAPQQLAIMPPNSAVVPSTSRVSNIIDINLHDLFSDFDSLPPTVISTHQSRTIHVPLFYGCTFTNPNITINGIEFRAMWNIIFVDYSVIIKQLTV
jgi:hypothetical protein